MINHDDYGNPIQSKSNSIALLRLSESVDLSEFPPVCLPPYISSNKDYTGVNGSVYGRYFLISITQGLYMVGISQYK